MAANDTSPPSPPSHYFHAEAYALTAKLTAPFEAGLRKQAYVKLEGDSEKLLLEGEEQKRLKDKKTPDNYFSEHPKPYRFEGLFSYSAAHTQVSGHRSIKILGAFVTLATSVVENLNILNVVTADKVVAQISTTHLPKQYSPEVTFLGTHFENLRIAQHHVDPVLNLGFAGMPPIGKDVYYPTKDTDFMISVKKQRRNLRDAFEKVKKQPPPKYLSKYISRLEDEKEDSWYSNQYHKFAAFSDSEYGEFQKRAAVGAKKFSDWIDGKAPKPPNGTGDKWEGVTCSLVERVTIHGLDDIKIPEKGDDDPIVIRSETRHFGHVIHVRDFGTIFLAELTVRHNSFHLTMIRTELGCIADGTGSMVACSVNGGGKGGGGGGT